MNVKELFNLTGLPVLIASLTNILGGQYRLIFVLAGLLTLVASLIFYFRKRGICTIDQVVRERNQIINKVLLVVITAVIGYILFFIVFLGWIGRLLYIWQ